MHLLHSHVPSNNKINKISIDEINQQYAPSMNNLAVAKNLKKQLTKFAKVSERLSPRSPKSIITEKPKPKPKRKKSRKIHKRVEDIKEDSYSEISLSPRSGDEIVIQ